VCLSSFKMKALGRWSALVSGILVFSSLQANSQQARQTLVRHVPQAVSTGAAKLLGPLSSTQRLNLSIVLPLRNQDQLTNLLKQIYDPSSPNYRHFLSVTDFADRFGPAPDDYQAVVAFAKAQGLTVKSQPANRMVVPINGTVEQVQNAFNVKMRNYQHPTENRVFFSADREPNVPPGLSVTHITGLNNYSLPKPQLQRPLLNGQKPADVQGSGPGGNYLGSDMRAAYYGGTTLTGAGQSVALVQFGGYLIDDVIADFNGAASAATDGSNFSLNYTPTQAGPTYTIAINNVLLDGQTMPSQSDQSTWTDDTEEALDLTQAISMAPGLSSVSVYVGLSDVDILTQIASDDAANQVSISWTWSPDDPETDDFLFEEMAAQGQSVFAATGDYGSYSVLFPSYFPGEDAYVTAVGGTDLLTSGGGGQWLSETAWGNSGGGVSPDAIPIPSWQQGIATDANQASTVYRNAPDVAMEGDFDNYACSLGSCQGGWGGTSFASPRWAGYMALVNQAAAVQGENPIGFLNPLVYAIGQRPDYSQMFHDITVGSNGLYAGYGIPYFNAVSGYDLVTGWGSPTGEGLISLLAPSASSSFQLAFSPSSLTVDPGASAKTTVTVNSIGGFSSPVTLSANVLPPGVTIAFSQNTVTTSTVMTVTAAPVAVRGSYLVQITGTSGELTATTNIAVQVDAPGLMMSTTNPLTWIAPGYASSIELDTWDLSGFTGTPTLTVTSALPSGVTAVLNPNTPIAPSYSSPSKTTGVSYLTFVPDASIPPSTSNITVTAQAGDVSDTRNVYLVAQAPQFRLNIQPMVLQIVQGSSIQMTVSAIAVGNFGNDPIALALIPGYPLPAGVTVTFNPTTIEAGQSSTMTVTTGASTPMAPFYITAEGTDHVIDMASDFGWQINVETPPGDLQFEIMPSVPYLAIAQGGAFTMHYTVIDAPGFDQMVSLSPPYTPGTSLDFGPPDPTGSRDVTYNATPDMPSGLWIGEAYGYYGTNADQEPIDLWILNKPTLPFTLGTQTGSISFNPGGSASTPVSIALENWYAGTVTLSTIGLPDGITASFDSNPTQTDTSLILAADSSVAPGAYFVNVTAIANGQTEVRTIPIQIGSIATATPVFSVAAGTYNSVQTVSISDLTPSAVIYYTLDGSTPTTGFTIYNSALTVASSETVKAIAIATGYTQSTVASATYSINLPAATPAISPAGGTFTSAQTVTISDTTPGAVIYYTTNGSTPTTSSTSYSGPITVSSSETIQAVAIASGYSQSAVASAAYTINLPAATPTFSVTPGTYTTAQTVAISGTTPGAVIYYTTDGATPTTSSTLYSGPITVYSSETIEAIATASGYSTSAVASAAYTINLPAATPTFSVTSGTYTTVQTVSISDTTPGAVIYYTTNGSTPTTGSTSYSGPITVSSSETIEAIATASGYSQSAVASAAYTINLPAATPSFSVTPGTYTSVQTVSISDTTPGAVIYYTTNVSTPTTGSTPYSGPITVSSSETIEAIATVSGYSTSAVASAAYTINLPAATPSFSVTPGTYSSVQTVSISDATPGSTIYYTTNGATPTTGSTPYSGPVTVSSSETIEAIATASGYSTSAVASAAYTINLPAATPSFSVTPGTYSSMQTVSISDSTPGAAIYYTTNGTTPTTSSCIYSGPVSVSATETIEAIATASGYSQSPVSTAVYTITPPAAAPVFSPAQGTFTSTQSVSISDSTPGEVIYYTTNGSTPTTGSTPYSGPFTVSSSETIEAIATASGYSTSAVASAAYTINLPAATPSFSVTPGTYTSVQTVLISDTTPGAVIYYTTNGATPTTGSTPYSGAITVSSSETIEAIATASGYSQSAVASAAYSINLPAATPSFSPTPGTYTSVQMVSISDTTPGAVIYYTANGSTPTTGSSIYSVPITVSATETIEAIATASGYSTSAVASAAYAITLPAATSVMGSISPAFTNAGKTTFTLTVTGSGFTSSAVVYWGSTALTTQFVGSTTVTAQVPAADIANTGVTAITVQIPAPGGAGVSNVLQFEVDSASTSTSSPSFTTSSATVVPGSTANYPVTLPNLTTNVSVSCLNLPGGATCSYSSTTGSVTIFTTTATPSGTYQVTVVFAETMSGTSSALVLMPILLLPLVAVRKKWQARRIWLLACLGIALTAGAVVGCGGSASVSTTPPLTHQVTSSGIVSITVQ